MELQQYDFKIQHRAGKANSNADALSRMYEPETSQTVSCFMMEPQEEIVKLWIKSRRLNCNDSMITTLDPNEFQVYEESYDGDTEDENDNGEGCQVLLNRCDQL